MQAIERGCSTAAKDLWPQSSAIGKAVCVNCLPENPRNWKQVVGVVSNIRHAAPDRPLQPNAYFSGGAMGHAVFMVVRTKRPTGELERAIRTAIAAVDPDQPVLLSGFVQAFIGDSIADRRFVMTLLVITGCLALLVASGGVYGVAMFMTSQRTQEFGIRMALGATPGGIHQLIFRQAFSSVASGLAVGIVATLAAMRLVRGFLEGTESGHPTYIGIAIVVVLLTTAMACWVPTRRVTAIDPNSILRIE